MDGGKKVEMDLAILASLTQSWRNCFSLKLCSLKMKTYYLTGLSKT